MQLDPTEEPRKIHIQEVIVFEERQHTTIRNYAHRESKSPTMTACVCNPNAREIIDNDCENQNQYIGRNESHIENTARSQQ